jgi:co-chaperonin GroES (HSP10)
MRAVNNFLVVEKEVVGPKQVGGLILTENLDSDNRYIRATVISVGNLVEGLKEGDIVYYDKHNGNGVDWKGKIYQVIQSRDVVLVE